MMGHNARLVSLIRRAETLERAHRPAVWVVQLGIFAFSGVAAFLLRFDGQIPPDHIAHLSWALAVWMTAKAVVFRLCGLDRGWWRFVSIDDVLCVGLGNLTGSAGSFLLIGLLAPPGFPRSIYLLDLVICFLGTSGVRVAIRMFRESCWQNGRSEAAQRTLIYGAGQAGVLLAREIAANRDLQWRVLGFIDDDPDKHGRQLLGFTVFDSASQLERILMSNPGATLIVSTVKLSAERCRRVDELCRRHRVRVKRFRIMFEDAAIPADSPLFPSEIFRVLPPPPGRDG